MIGSALAAELRREGVRVLRLVRHASSPSADDIPWSPDAGVLDATRLEGLDAIVNLAGAPIAERWSTAHKRDIRESRVRATTLLSDAVSRLERMPAVVLSGSAVGYYGDRGDDLLDESSTPGTDFLSGVTRDWEAATAPMSAAGVRVAHLRTGIVLSRTGGALEKMLTPFQLGLGGPMGSGQQWMSWISLTDHVRAMRHVIATDTVRGAVNLVAPAPVRNADFAHALGHALNRPAVLPLPAFALRLMFGEMADATLLAGQRVLPAVLTSSGFTFTSATLDAALAAELQG